MEVHRHARTTPRPGGCPPRTLALALLAFTVLSAVQAVAPSGGPSHPSASPPSAGSTAAAGGPSAATEIVSVGPSSSAVGVGLPARVLWQAEDGGGTVVASFAAGCSLSVSFAATGGPARAWVNVSGTEPLSRSPNGTFSVPSGAWSGGELNVTLAAGAAGPISVQLFGSGLPSRPTAVNLTVLADLDHLLLFDPKTVTNSFANNSSAGLRTNETYWHVRDRFGDPVPGALLEVEVDAGALQSQQSVPVAWANSTTTGAWVNYSIAASDNGTFRVLDAAHDTLLGPVVIAAVPPPPPPPAASLSPLAVAAVAALAAGGVGGIAALSFGGRRRPTDAGADGEEELRRLAEGRATVVDLLRRSGPMSLKEVEAAWEPPPAPAAVADWLASLVTDGTLSAEIGEGGQARFALVEHPVEEPKVTFDETALEREIARRDEAVGGPDEPDDGRRER